MSQDSTNNNSKRLLSLAEFDATGVAAPTPITTSANNSQATPPSALTPPADPMARIPKKKMPAWYLKAQEEKESRNMQACLEDYFGNDAFKLGQGESIEAVVEGHDVAIIWDTERNRMKGYPRPAIETTYRRRVVHDALFEDYTEEYVYSDDDEY